LTLYEIQAIFSTLLDVPQHHVNFLYHLQQRIENWNPKTTIGDLLTEHVHIFIFIFIFLF